jgi:hypothetical protein
MKKEYSIIKKEAYKNGIKIKSIRATKHNNIVLFYTVEYQRFDVEKNTVTNLKERDFESLEHIKAEFGI